MRMKVLWLCNIILPAAAKQMGVEASSKEGWLSGLADVVLANQKKNGIDLSVAFPMGNICVEEKHCENTPQGEWPQGRSIHWKEDGRSTIEERIIRGQAALGEACFHYYGFPEDTRNPEKYDESLEPVLKKIVDMVRPDVVHCFGTEYPHTLAMCRILPEKDKLLVGLQGLCTLCAKAYFSDLPEKVIYSATLRDYLRKDTLLQQQEKFRIRGNREREIIRLAGNVTGRTDWDRQSAENWNPNARYHKMNETLRPEFYGPVWAEDQCIPHSIFLSQGDYPLKGLHYMLLALPEILVRYPDAKVYVAGNSLVNYKTLKEKLKISAYGKYLRELLRAGALEEKVIFLGKLDAVQMLDRYLKSSVFVCPSALENSPNSLGEAMLLGMPCVSASVGGITSIFTGGEDGVLYEGHILSGDADEAEPEKCREGSVEKTEGRRKGSRGGGRRNGRLKEIAGNLTEAVLEIWGDSKKRKRYCENARRHAMETHNREENYRRLVEIYEDIL